MVEREKNERFLDGQDFWNKIVLDFGLQIGASKFEIFIVLKSINKRISNKFLFFGLPS